MLTPVVQMPSQAVIEGKQESLGTFSNGVHTVNGTVKVITDKTDPNKKYLYFETISSQILILLG